MRRLLAAATALVVSIVASPVVFGQARADATVVTNHPAEGVSTDQVLDAGSTDVLRADAAGPISYFTSGPTSQQYRWLIAAVIVMGAQMILIAALLWYRRQRSLVEKVLLSREATLRASYSRTRELARGLIHAQEAARIALAQDLHDDICQDIVGLGMSIDTFAQSSGRMQDPKNQYALAKLHQGVLDVAGHVRLISHELHPATLQLLGLAPAVKAHCLEVEARYHAQVSLHTTGDMTSIHPPTALCLFRVAQESMRNAAVHGEARHIEVSVTRFGDDIELAIRDDGRGFDVESTRRDSRGLGLVSMEERVHTAGGEVMMWSKPGEGTTVLACVPARAARTTEEVSDEALTSPYDTEIAPSPGLIGS